MNLNLFPLINLKMTPQQIFYTVWNSENDENYPDGNLKSFPWRRDKSLSLTYSVVNWAWRDQFADGERPNKRTYVDRILWYCIKWKY